MPWLRSSKTIIPEVISWQHLPKLLQTDKGNLRITETLLEKPTNVGFIYSHSRKNQFKISRGNFGKKKNKGWHNTAVTKYNRKK